MCTYGYDCLLCTYGYGYVHYQTVHVYTVPKLVRAPVQTSCNQFGLAIALKKSKFGGWYATVVTVGKVFN